MSTIEKQDIINTDNLSTQYGIAAGIMMSALLLAFQISGSDFSPFMKLSKYIILALLLTVALKVYKNKISGDIFIKGISFGAKLSFVAGLVLVITNFVLYFINPAIAFSKYGLEPSAVSGVAVISAILFFETFVFGNIISFSVLQYLKGGRLK